jgi:predicted ATPase/DNA-binding CsgD family transcriptional regulator
MAAFETETTLPIPLSTFVGREAELESLRQLLASGARLITLTGPGGVGKTRLALECAALTAAGFADGAVFVSLQALTESGQVISEVANAMRVRESGNRSIIEDLSAALANRHILICVDNWEHVLEAAPQLAELLMACRRVFVLATSREALRVQGEHEFPVHPLDLPHSGHAPLAAIAQTDAVRLFAARGQAVRPEFKLDEANAHVIGEICELLDGLPLAIELAAALMRLFSPHALLTRLKSGSDLAARSPTMRLLAGGPRDLPVRQQTLRAAVGWSYNLLGPDEQRLFRRLAIFAGGCDLEAAEAICRDESSPRPILDSLIALADKNLLRAEQVNGEPRFGMLRTIQEFALELLQASGEAGVVHGRHAAYYVDLFERAVQVLHGPDGERWREHLDREHDNFRVVLGWSLEHDELTTAFRLGGNLWRFWAERGHITEGRRWLNRILARDGDVPLHFRANVLNGAGGLAVFQDDYLTGQQHLTECLSLRRELGDISGVAASLHNLAQLAIRQREDETALARIRESLALDRELGDRSGIASDLLAIAWILCLQKDFETAREHVQQSLIIAQELGDVAQLARAYALLGDVALGQENHEQARHYLAESKAAFGRLGDILSMASVDHGMGQIALHQRRLKEAEQCFIDSLNGKAEAADKLGIVNALEGLACLAAARFDVTRAAQLWGACEVLRRALGFPRPDSEQSFCERYMAMARSQLRERAFLSAHREGEAMSLDEAVRYALKPLNIEDGKPAPGAAHALYPAGLSAREVEVLALVAQGLSDGEVAEKLVLSPRTINAHLTSIYNKIGVNSRAAATRFAVDKKLV